MTGQKMIIPRKLAHFQLITLCVCLGLSFLFFSSRAIPCTFEAARPVRSLVEAKELSRHGQSRRRIGKWGGRLDGLGLFAASDEVTAQDYCYPMLHSVHVADGSYVVLMQWFCTPE